MEKALDNILNTNTKLKIIRFFISQRNDFIASGREVGRSINITAPAVHAALKELYEQKILNRIIKGKSHLYLLNNKDRVVKTILIPAFQKESSFRKDIVNFIKDKIKKNNIGEKIVSVMLYGSQQTKEAAEDSDVDIAVIVHNTYDLQKVEEIFIEKISPEFDEYFRVHIDAYVKTQEDFIDRLRKKQPPVITLIKSYLVIYGEDPLSWIQ